MDIPFAERVDNDDSAVFRVFPDKVTIVIQHWGAESDYYVNGDFWDWFQLAINDLLLIERINSSSDE